MENSNELNFGQDVKSTGKSSPPTFTSQPSFFASQATEAISIPKREEKIGPSIATAPKPDSNLVGLPDVLFFSIVNFLDPKNIHLYLGLTNRQIWNLSGTLAYWKSFYFNSKETNRQQVLQAAIERIGCSILHQADIQEELTFKVIAGLRVGRKSLLVHTMQQSQLSLRQKYLTEAQTKKMAINAQCAEMQLEFKRRDIELPGLRVEVPQLPAEGQIRQHELEFQKLLAVFKKITNRDLETHLSRYEESQWQYIRSYFDAIFLSGEEWQKIIEPSGAFGQRMLTILPECEISLGKGDYGLSVGKGRFRTNMFLLVVQLGNIGLLVASHEKIKALIVASLEMGSNELTNPNRSVHFGELLALSAQDGDEAIMQFLYGLGAPVETEAQEYQYVTALGKALRSYQDEAVKLIIAHGEVDSFKACSFTRSPLSIACFEHNISGMLILYAAGVDLNNQNSNNTSLERQARDIGMFTRRITKEKGGDLETGMRIGLSGDPIVKKLGLGTLPIKLEMLRVLLICGTDPLKVEDDRARTTINMVYKINEDLRSSFLDKQKWQVRESKAGHSLQHKG